jgi:hypothetical protein
MEIYGLFHHIYNYNISDTINKGINLYNVWHSFKSLVMNPGVTSTDGVVPNIQND